jgi:hypothetical protein
MNRMQFYGKYFVFQIFLSIAFRDNDFGRDLFGEELNYY